MSLNTEHVIVLNEENDIKIKVIFFDANHCAGAVMILFEGYMGRIFHTGDFRFNPSMFEEYNYIFP